HRSSVLPLFFLLLRRRPPCPPFFPYTTLFRSRGVSLAPCWHQILCIGASGLRFNAISEASETRFSDFGCAVLRWTAELIIRDARSEEHTSELQSRENLVCRLLLEKKKKRKIQK